MNALKLEEATKGKIVLIKGQSRYNVLRLACDVMARGFEEQGYDTVTIDLAFVTNLEEMVDIINKEMADRGLFVFSFNALCHEVYNANDIALYDWLDYPVYGFLVDYPYFHHSRLCLTQSDKITIGCVDYNHVTYLEQYYPNIKHVHFVPHFSFQNKELEPYGSRVIDIFFPGSFDNPQIHLDTLKQLPEVFYNIAKSIIAMMLKDINLTVEEALRLYLASVYFTYSESEFVEIMDQIYILDHYIRSYYRDKIIRTILDAGITLTVCGQGWEQLKETYSENLNVIGTEGLDIEDNVKLIANSKILLNILPSFKNGTHERIFTSMLNKCICLTNPNQYFEQHFKDKEEILYYRLDALETLPAIIEHALLSSDEMSQITERAYQVALDNYSMKHVAGIVLKQMGV